MVGLFGLLGNMLSISVLSSKDMNNSFYKLLLSLSVFDSVFITFVTLEYSFVRGEAGGKSGRQNKVVLSSFFLAHHGHQHGLHIHLPQGKTLAVNLALTLSVLRSSTLSTTSACAAVSTPPWPCPMRGGSTVRLTSIADLQVHCCLQSLQVQREPNTEQEQNFLQNDSLYPHTWNWYQHSEVRKRIFPDRTLIEIFKDFLRRPS